MQQRRFYFRMRGWVSLCLILMVLAGSAGTGAAEAHGDFLDDLARVTWAYLSAPWSSHNHLPGSWRLSGVQDQGDYANPAEIGLYALSWLAAYDMGQPWSPTWAQAEAEAGAVVDQLRAWQTGSQAFMPNGDNAYKHSVFYQWYWIGWTPPVVGAPMPAESKNKLVPSIDNAWLAASLMTIQAYAQTNGHAALAQKAEAVLADMNFDLWFHPDRALYTWGGIEDPQDEQNHWFADTYSDENRIINFVARALGQLSCDEFQSSLKAMTQTPGTYDGISVERVNWDGSYFTYTAPALFIREGQTAYGANTTAPATLAQIRYGQNQGYGAWGFSDCYDVGMGGYVQAGAPPSRVTENEQHPGLVAPFAAALALNTPSAGVAAGELESLSTQYTCAFDAGYGFRDSVMTNPADPAYATCSDRFSALGQEWVFLSLADYRTGFIWKYFYRYPGVERTHREMFSPSTACWYVPAVGK